MQNAISIDAKLLSDSPYFLLGVIPAMDAGVSDHVGAWRKSLVCCLDFRITVFEVSLGRVTHMNTSEDTKRLLAGFLSS